MVRRSVGRRGKKKTLFGAVRKYTYKLGRRPKMGTVLYSPALDFRYGWLDMMKTARKTRKKRGRRK